MDKQRGRKDPKHESPLPKPLLDLQKRDKQHFKPYLKRASEIAKAMDISVTDALLVMVLNFLVQLHSRPEE